MNKTTIPNAVAAIILVLLTAGCDMPVLRPVDAEGNVPKTLVIAPDRPDELAAVAAMETARMNYEYRLIVLQDHYTAAGNMDKLLWAKREAKNLADSQAFTWVGLDPVAPPAEQSPHPGQHALVEQVIAARQQYKAALTDLTNFYDTADMDFQAACTRNIQDRLDPVYTYMYFLSAEIPPADLKAVEVIPDAETL